MTNLNVGNIPAAPRLPVIPDQRGALMESIRSGAQLKKVEVSSNASNSSGDSRNDLLSEIRGGIELRPVGERPAANRSSGEVGRNDDLADALRKALEMRKIRTQESSSEDSDQNSDDDNEWSD
jgi:WH2 motif